VSTRTDSLLAAATLAHETVHGLSRNVIEIAGASDSARTLVRESAHIATIQMPALSRRVERLRVQLGFERLTKSSVAGETARKLATEEAGVVPRMEAHLARLREIVDAMRSLVDEA
jgi:hypothetical protein